MGYNKEDTIIIFILLVTAKKMHTRRIYPLGMSYRTICSSLKLILLQKFNIKSFLKERQLNVWPFFCNCKKKLVSVHIQLASYMFYIKKAPYDGVTLFSLRKLKTLRIPANNANPFFVYKSNNRVYLMSVLFPCTCALLYPRFQTFRHQELKLLTKYCWPSLCPL